MPRLPRGHSPAHDDHATRYDNELPPPVELATLCAGCAMVLSALAYVQYIRDILAGRARPQRSTWLIWTTLVIIALASQVAEGASLSLGFAAAQAGGSLAILSLSFTRGMGAYLHGRDAAVLLAAGIGLVLWYLTSSAVYALMLALGISALGGLVNIAKAYAQPQTEAITSWVMSCTAGALAALSVGQIDWVLLAHPIYAVLTNGAVTLAILLGRRHAQPDPEPDYVIPFEELILTRMRAQNAGQIPLAAQ